MFTFSSVGALPVSYVEHKTLLTSLCGITTGLFKLKSQNDFTCVEFSAKTKLDKNMLSITAARKDGLMRLHLKGVIFL